NSELLFASRNHRIGSERQENTLFEQDPSCLDEKLSVADPYADNREVVVIIDIKSERPKTIHSLFGQTVELGSALITSEFIHLYRRQQAGEGCRWARAR